MLFWFMNYCCCLVAKLCPALSKPMDCSMPGFHILHYLLVCLNSCPLSWWCYPTISNLHHPLLLLPSIFPRIWVFSDESAICIRWPKFGTSASVLVSFRIDWFEHFAVWQTQEPLQHHNLKASVLWRSAFFMVQFSHLYVTSGKTIIFIIEAFVSKVMSLLFNMLSRYVIAFLPRSKHLLISCLQYHPQWFWSPRK